MADAHKEPLARHGDEDLISELARLENALDALLEEESEPETPTGFLGGFLGYDSDFGPVIGLTGRFDPFLSAGQSLALSLERGEDGAGFGLDLYNRSLFAGAPALYLGFDWSERDPVRDFDFAHEYSSLRLGFSWKSEASGETALYALYGRDEISEPGSLASPLILADLGEVSKRGLGLGWRKSFGSSDASQAVTLRLNAELGRLSNDTDYHRIELSTGLRRTFREGLSLQAELRAGHHATSGGSSRISDRFQADSGLIRGFDYGGIGPRDLGTAGAPALGGERYAALRLDLQQAAVFGLPETVKLGMFFDAGALWQAPDAPLVDQGKDLRSAAGLSLSAELGAAELRFELAAPLAKEAHDQTRIANLRLSTRF